ncbi:unnamed protein product [Malus baccata var. baccata]
MEKTNALSGSEGSGGDGSVCGYDSLHRLLNANLKPHLFQEVNHILLGLNRDKALETISLPESAKALSSGHDFDLQVGTLPTTAHFLDQKRAIFEKVKPIIDAVSASGVNVLCLKEVWTMPFAFCTREKMWCEFAEPVDRKLTRFLQDLAWTPILERDVNHGETFWDTVVIIGNNGNIIGKHRKNHITRVGDFNGSTYYMEGNTGHPVFETAYGKIVVNICYGRHHPLNCLAFCLSDKDKWGFQMTARYDLYADLLAYYLKPDFEPKVIFDPLLYNKYP